jgi:hypothetical protein
MIIVETVTESVDAIKSLSNTKLYTEMSNAGFDAAKTYDWEKIKKDYLAFVNSVLDKNKTNKSLVSNSKKEKILLYSIVRNIEPKFDQYYQQIKKIAKTFTEYEFYLSIYENDSTDKTKSKLHTSDWSFLNGVSIVTENINT